MNLLILLPVRRIQSFPEELVTGLQDYLRRKWVNAMLRPFALEIYRIYLRGKTAQQLADETGIPLERIQQRIRAAEAYVKLRRKRNAA